MGPDLNLGGFVVTLLFLSLFFTLTEINLNITLQVQENQLAMSWPIDHLVFTSLNFYDLLFRHQPWLFANKIAHVHSR